MHPLLISDVVSNYTQLSEVTKSGKRFGKCPFLPQRVQCFFCGCKAEHFFLLCLRRRWKRERFLCLKARVAQNEAGEKGSAFTVHL